MVRRFRLGPWGIAGIVSVALFVAIATIVFQFGSQTKNLTLAFAPQAPKALIMVTQRMLAETSWAGSGAGTFAAILPIYRGIDELASGDIAPTAAAALAVEMGRPFFWAILMAMAALVFALLTGALRRRRDLFYSAAGAGCIVAVVLLSFGNSAVLSTPVSIIAAVVIGMAIAQRKSRWI